MPVGEMEFPAQVTRGSTDTAVMVASVLTDRSRGLDDILAGAICRAACGRQREFPGFADS